MFELSAELRGFFWWGRNKSFWIPTSFIPILTENLIRTIPQTDEVVRMSEFLLKNIEVWANLVPSAAVDSPELCCSLGLLSACFVTHFMAVWVVRIRRFWKEVRYIDPTPMHSERIMTLRPWWNFFHFTKILSCPSYHISEGRTRVWFRILSRVTERSLNCCVYI